MSSRIGSLVLCLLLLGSMPAWAGQQSKSQAEINRIGNRDVTKGSLDLYSTQREFEIGKEMAQRIEELTTPLNDPETQAYMQALVERIVRNSDAKVPVQVKIIYSNQVNAFALPGGFLFVNMGLILQTRSEAELAGVVAHEVAHIAERDATRQMTQAEVLKWMSLPLLYFGGPAGFAIRGAVALGGPLNSMVFSRRAEKRADLVGLQYLYKSGYDPEGYVDFFERVKDLEKDPHGMIARAFASHPLTKDRIVAAQQEIAKNLPAKSEYVVTTSDYQHVRNHLEQMVRDEMTDVPSPATKIPVLKKGFNSKGAPSGQGQ